MFIGQFARANELDEWSHTGVKYSQRPLRSLHGNSIGIHECSQCYQSHAKTNAIRTVSWSG